MFLQDSDYTQIIKEDQLESVLDGDANAKDEAEKYAVATVKSYLSNRYDITAEFAKTGADRHPVLVNLVMDITVYRLHLRINPRQIPDVRRMCFEDAMKELEKIQRGNSNPDGLTAITTPDGFQESGSRFGSNPKMIHRF